MRPVELLEVLEARERRAKRQRELLELYGCPLVCFTMNIAGPVKNTEEIAWGFQYGSRLLLRQLDRVKAKLLHWESISEATGNEAFFAVDLEPSRLKALTVELEEQTALGRLFDLDVLSIDGSKLERQTERSCIICGLPGKACARSRAHSVSELQHRTNEILKQAQKKWILQTASEVAVRALLFEACTTPKPGLVDRDNSGSHTDMDLFTFMSSSAALHPYYEKCVRIGIETANELPEKTFADLRWPGKEAELRMLDVTNGVNTHKGAIFTLGVLCAALGRLGLRAWSKPSVVLQECAAMTKGVSTELTKSEYNETAGGRLYHEFGVMGVRGQMEAGLPAVLLYGLPAMDRLLADGASLEQAGSVALLTMIPQLQDTNMLKRGGIQTQQWANRLVEQILLEGNVTTEQLRELDAAFIQRNLSPGGAADLLAVCYLFYFLRKEVFWEL